MKQDAKELVERLIAMGATEEEATRRVRYAKRCQLRYRFNKKAARFARAKA